MNDKHLRLKGKLLQKGWLQVFPSPISFNRNKFLYSLSLYTNSEVHLGLP